MMRISQEWNKEDRDYIRRKLIDYNSSKLPDEVKQPIKVINFIMRDDEDQIVGGITGTIFWHRLYIDFLWMEESLRGNGYGGNLLMEIESFAREQNCRLIQLDTFSFQAPDFYRKNGYEVVGVVGEFPTKEHKQYYLVKRLD